MNTVCCCRCKICSDVNSCCLITSLGGESYAAELPSVLETFEGMLWKVLCLLEHMHSCPHHPPPSPPPSQNNTMAVLDYRSVC